ncbi:MAG: YIP1 family protein [Bacteroidales bacterium]|nr:YIP1 family protein [Bacteroidales bacterium]
MNLIERVKGIILNPKTEWNTIQQEKTSSTDLLVKYLIPLALIPTIAGFIGYGLIGRNMPFAGHFASVSYGIKYAIIMFINLLISAYVTAFVIDSLAPTFSAVKNFDKAFSLVVYSLTPMMVAGVLYIYPPLALLVMLASLYGLYILYIGLKPMMQAPDDKVTVYFIVSLIVMIAVYFIISLILTSVILRPALTGF